MKQLYTHRKLQKKQIKSSGRSHAPFILLFVCKVQCLSIIKFLRVRKYIKYKFLPVDNQVNILRTCFLCINEYTDTVELFIRYKIMLSSKPLFFTQNLRQKSSHFCGKLPRILVNSYMKEKIFQTLMFKNVAFFRNLLEKS